MECKFLDHGIAISYNHVATPCCHWTSSKEWIEENQITKIDLATWHNQKGIVEAKETLARGDWPESCVKCKIREEQGRYDSMRGNGAQAYRDYQPGDITLEIRPGNTCNFACQTCWPEASSRITQYYRQAGLINIEQVDSRRITDFEYLNSIRDRIKNIVLLGGEPFYDKSCIAFIKWARENLAATLVMFTNGSVIDYDFVENYSGKLILVFSLDAVGTPAEYIRIGTVWSDVHSNYQRVLAMPSVETRVNITPSVYNYAQLEQLIDYLIPKWPAVVSFGIPPQSHYLEHVIPLDLRQPIIDSFARIIDKLEAADIEEGQKANAVNSFKVISNNLQTVPWSKENYAKWREQTNTMDRLKEANASEFCGFLKLLLEQEVN